MKFTTPAMFVLGVLFGAMGLWLLEGASSEPEETKSGDRAPLYWVAPMDPNYKRDKPGKSPMGMDLIPVYAEDQKAESPGTVTINPDVVNNLGVRTAQVSWGELDTTVKTVGYVQYDEEQLVQITPRVEGWVETLYVKAVGEPVTKGTPLYAIYSPTLVNAQEELLLAMKRSSQPALIQAATDRLAALKVPKDEIERLKNTGKIKQTITIDAPQSGVLDSLEVREGAFVTPGTNMMLIGKPEHIWVIGDIFEQQAALVNVGDSVRIQVDYMPASEWRGNLDYIYPSLDPTNRTLRVRVRLENPKGILKPGMFARLTIDSRPLGPTLLVPREALIRTANLSKVVLALGEGRFKSVAVEVGLIADEYAQILGGLEGGERVVTSAQFLIDSESSKTSDFRRMHHGSEASTVVADSVWVSARLENLMPENRTASITHEPIEAWQWPAMTMDFILDHSVDFSRLEAGMELRVQIYKKDDEYRIRQVEIAAADAVQDRVWVEAQIKNLMPAQRAATLYHAPIEAWQWPAMTMDFILDKNIDMRRLKVGMDLKVKIYEQDGAYRVSEVKIPNTTPPNAPTEQHQGHKNMTHRGEDAQ